MGAVAGISKAAAIFHISKYGLLVNGSQGSRHPFCFILSL